MVRQVQDIFPTTNAVEVESLIADGGVETAIEILSAQSNPPQTPVPPAPPTDASDILSLPSDASFESILYGVPFVSKLRFLSD